MTRSSTQRGLFLALATGAALAAASPVGAGGICSPGGARGGVAILVVATPQRVQRWASSVHDARVVRRDAETVLFADGRVVTSNVEGLGPHLNALGWAGRRIEIVGSFSTRRARRPG